MNDVEFDAGTGAARADVIHGIAVAVIARGAVRLVCVRAGAVAIAHPASLMALVGRSAGKGGAGTNTARAHVILGAGVAVVAGCAVGFRWIRAGACGRIAGAGGVALITRRAGDGSALTSPVNTSIAGGAGVAVITRRAVSHRRIRAGTCGRIAGAGNVTLVELRAGDGSALTSPVNTSIADGAGVAVIARCAVRFIGPRSSRG